MHARTKLTVASAIAEAQITFRSASRAYTSVEIATSPAGCVGDTLARIENVLDLPASMGTSSQ